MGAPVNFYSRPDIDTSTALLYIPGDGADGSTSIIDSTGRHTITAGGNAQIDTAQSVSGGGSVLFDGNDDYLTLPDVNTDFDLLTSDFTLDLYIRFSNFNGLGAVASLFQQGNISSTINHKAFTYANTNPTGEHAFSLRTASSDTATSQQIRFELPNGTMLIDTWYRVTFTCTSGVVRFYLDGVEVSTVSATNVLSIIPNETNLSSDFYIGASPLGTSNELNGWIDEMIWYNTARIPGGKAINFYSRPGTDTNQALLYLPMDGTDQSTTFIDATGNHTVTTTGSAQIDTAFSVFGTGSGLFDGTTDYLIIPQVGIINPAAGDFTLDFYVMFNALPVSGRVMAFFTQQDPANSLRFQRFYMQNSAGVYQLVYSSGNPFTGNNQLTMNLSGLSINIWYHITYTKLGNKMYIYVDGVLITAGSSPDLNTNHVVYVPGDTYIADWNNGGSVVTPTWGLNGWIDELIWYNYARYPGGAPVNFYSMP